MKRSVRRVWCLVVGITASILLGSFSSVVASEPTLARLAFWVPAERMEDFGIAYVEKVIPILEEHG